MENIDYYIGLVESNKKETEINQSLFFKISFKDYYRAFLTLETFASFNKITLITSPFLA